MSACSSRELLRNKSGVEGDGAALIGQALGGATPKIRLNRLQTESEKNVQKGMELLLRGIYQLVRNPRSHGKISDSEDDAQSIILFVGYLVKQLDQAKSQFSLEDFVRRVLDPDFVPKERYAELLVSEIPQRARLDVLLALYKESENWTPRNIRLFLKVLFEHLEEEEIKQACEVLTHDLATSESDITIRVALGSFPPNIWSIIGEVARLRAENKVIRSIQDGRVDIISGKCVSGALGTWSTNIFSVMTLKEEMISAIATKIRSTNFAERLYILNYIFDSTPALSDKIPRNITIALCTRLKAGDQRIYDKLQFPPWPKKDWPPMLKKEYASFQAAELTNESTFDFDEDIPF